MRLLRLWAEALGHPEADVGACGRLLVCRGWDVKVATAAEEIHGLLWHCGWHPPPDRGLPWPVLTTPAAALRPLPGHCPVAPMAGGRSWMSCVPGWWPGAAER
jgi:hypothetical protein